MQKYKIIKEIHKYSTTDKVVYRIEKKHMFGWSDLCIECQKYEDAEELLVTMCYGKQGGIFTVDGNVYTFNPFCLPLP